MFGTFDEAHAKRERAKAKKLRQSGWWQSKIADPICYYCSKKIEDKKDITMDHVVPLSRGGTSSRGNIVVCCKSCNLEKRSKTAAELLLPTLH